jgi:dTDP-4-amino-4,6-dideoxygalactose transaminase
MSQPRFEILMNDFGAEPCEVRERELAAVKRVIESSWYVLGAEVESFERQWSTACGVEHCVGVANGMDAIEIALRACGIGSGHEVVTTPMTAFATVLGIVRAGAEPVLADIVSGTGLLCPESVRRCIGPRCRAVIPVHLYGQVRGMDQWEDLCGKLGLVLLEDCAQSHLASWRGRGAGTFGAAGAFSFYPTKNLGAIGDAGALVTRDGSLADRGRVLRNYGQSVRYHHPVIGLNSRLDEVQAAILSARLSWLAAFTQRRQRIARMFRDGIAHSDIELLDPPQEEAAHVHHLFVVRCRRREALQAHLASCGIQTLIHYPVPVHLQEPCLHWRRDPRGLRNSESHAQTCLSIPCHPQMSDEQVCVVIEACNRFGDS